MHYESSDKSHKIAITICIILAILSPHWFAQESKENKTIVYQTSNEIKKTESSSWTVQKTKGDRKKDSRKVRTPEEIFDQINHLWYRREPTIALIWTCKGSSLDPRHCILVWLTLMYNEAGNKQNSKACVDRNNCFGIESGRKSYSSLDEGMENWVHKYNRYWYKAESAWFFYSSAWKVSPSRYCTSEDSSWSSVWCPHGLSIASDKWWKLKSIIY